MGEHKDSDVDIYIERNSWLLFQNKILPNQVSNITYHFLYVNLPKYLCFNL